MTENQILSMQGKELDTSVAEHVMGYKRFYSERMELDGWDMGNNVWGTHFEPSTNISAAWEVQESVMNRGDVMKCEYIRNLAKVSGADLSSEYLHDIGILLQSTPEQRCKAALLTVFKL